MLVALALPVLLLHAAPLDDIVTLPSLEVGVSMSCSTDEDCAIFPSDPYCHPALEECTECFEDAHCDEGWACSATGSCFDACDVDADCEGVGGAKLCDPEGRCVDCFDHRDCAPEEFCAAGDCVPDACVAGARTCSGVEIIECNAEGNGSATVEVCREPCIETPDGAVCPDGGGTSTTGAATTSASTSSGPDPAATTTSETSDGDDGGIVDRSGCGCSLRMTPSSGLVLWFVVLGARRRRR